MLFHKINPLKATKDVEKFLTEDANKAVTFIKNLAIKSSVVKELIVLLYSIDEDLSKSVFHTHILENLREELIYSIGDDKYSVPERKSLINALRGFPDIEEDLRKEAIENLKQIIDNSTYPSLRQSSVSTLGQIGEGEEGVAEYLLRVADANNENDALRFLSLIELGRDKKYFLTSIERLSKWLEDRENIVKKLIIQSEIPDPFIDSLLSTTEEEYSKNHIIVIKELVGSRILGLELKLKFSETLLNWDDSPENKTFLRKLYVNANPVEDISSYLKNNLFKESISKEDYDAFQFLITELITLGDSRATIESLYDIKYIIEGFKKEPPIDWENFANKETLKKHIDFRNQEFNHPWDAVPARVNALIGLHALGVATNEEEKLYNQAVEKRIIAPRARVNSYASRGEPLPDVTNKTKEQNVITKKPTHSGSDLSFLDTAS